MAMEQFPPTMAARLQELAETRATLLSELADSNLNPEFKEDGRWSIGEIVYHLYLVENRITGLLKMLLGGEKRDERATEERLTREWTLTSSRAIDPEVKSQAPAGTLPEQAPSFAEAVAMLKKSREALLSVVNDASLDDLASVSAPHPLEVIGLLTGAGWFSLIAHHEHRHTRQICNIKLKLAAQ